MPSKLRSRNGFESEVNDLQQEIPPAKEWEDFLTNDANKYKLINLLVSYITSKECYIGKVVYTLTTVQNVI